MANEYLKRTPTSTGNRKVFTWSGWIKRDSSAEGFCFGAGTSNSNRFALAFNGSGDEDITIVNTTTSNTIVLATERKYRDFSSWIHFLVVVDTTRLEEENRVRFYINGDEENFRSGFQTYPGINDNVEYNNLNPHVIGVRGTYSLANFFTGQMSDVFMVDGQALTPDVFGFYKDGKGYISAGSTQSTDFRPGQWVPKKPSAIKNSIINSGGFGVNGFYLPMNDSSNFGADFHTTPNSIITLKGENLPQPQNGAPTTTDAYVSQLRTDPYSANLVLAVPGITGAPGVAYTDFSANIKGSGTNKVLTAFGNAGVAATASYYGSAMSFDGSGDYFTLPANDTDFQPGSDNYTVEVWVNPDDTSAQRGICGIWDTTNNQRSWLLYHDNSGVPIFIVSEDGTFSSDWYIESQVGLTTNQWTHLVGEKEGNNIRIYVNGVVTGIKTTAPTSVYTNTDDPITIGAYDSPAGNEFDGHIQDLRVYKGVAKYKGGFDVPKPYTPVGIGTWRAVPDTTANNFCTMNPLIGATQRSGSIENTIVTYTDGNLTTRNNASAGWAPQMISFSNFGMTTGKWYWECSNFSTTNNEIVGISKGNEQGSPTGSGTGIESLISYNGNNGTIYVASQSDTTGSIVGASATITNSAGNSLSSTSDVVGFAFDAGNSSMTVYLNGTLNNTATNITPTPRSVNLPWVVTKSSNSSGTGSGMTWNFGQNPTFSGNINAGLSTFTDSNGKGLFRYEPPSGHLALCEDNLPTPAIADPGEHFKSVLWTGAGGSRSITGIGFTPDMVWVKQRNTTRDHHINDSVRGPGFSLYPNLTLAETSNTARLRSFDSDGFSIGGNVGWNQDGGTYVAWCWKAGAGTTSTNTDGSINSVVSVNQDAGFSIVSYVGTGNSETIGHGLAKTPAMIVCKSRDAADAWPVWHQTYGSLTNNYIQFEGTAGVGTITDYWNTSAPNATTFGVRSGSYAHNLSGDRHIAYCWSEIEGFSKFGSYTGNGTANGPFVYCGFKPAWVLIKLTTGSDHWFMCDSSRSSTNPVTRRLDSSDDIAEVGNFTSMDFLSNGFKLRTSNGQINTQGGTHIFAAFAESPFQTANSK